jgi:hypothetical protein
LLLWNTPRPYTYKYIRYPKAALDNLLSALAQTNCVGKEKRRDCIDLLRQACSVADTIKYRQEDVTAAVLDRFTNTVSFEREGRNHLFGIITDFSKLFRSKVADILATIRDLFEEKRSEKDFLIGQQIGVPS